MKNGREREEERRRSQKLRRERKEKKEQCDKRVEEVKGQFNNYRGNQSHKSTFKIM